MKIKKIINYIFYIINYFLFTLIIFVKVNIF